MSCTCDVDYYCGEHTDCPLCERPMPNVDQTMSPKLCPRCEATAKAGGRSLARERDWIGREGAALRSGRVT